jgi:hypothetical protein
MASNQTNKILIAVGIGAVVYYLVSKSRSSGGGGLIDGGGGGGGGQLPATIPHPSLAERFYHAYPFVPPAKFMPDDMALRIQRFINAYNKRLGYPERVSEDGVFGVQTAKARWLINTAFYDCYEKATDASLNGKPLFPMLWRFSQTRALDPTPEFLIKSSVATEQMKCRINTDMLEVLFSPFVMGDGDVELLKATPRLTADLTDNWRKSPPEDDAWHE